MPLPFTARLLIPSLLLTACTTLCSCDAFQKLVKGEQKKTLQIPKLGKLSVVTTNGSIRVSQGSSPTVEIHAEIRARSKERLAQVQIHADPEKVNGLRIFATFPEKRLSNEGCSFTILVHETQAIDLQTSNGAISLNKLQGPAHLHTSNGRIEIFDHLGPLDLSTSNGSIRVRDADGRVKAKTSNGLVDIVLREDNKGPVEVKTSNGLIRLKVGKAFEGSLFARTSNGLIKAEFPEGIQMERKKRKEMRLRFSEKGAESVLRTSNGVIQLGMR